MKLEILNKDAVDAWVWEHCQMGHVVDGIKGPPPEGATYSDGDPILRPINVGFRDRTTGEEIRFERPRAARKGEEAE